MSKINLNHWRIFLLIFCLLTAGVIAAFYAYVNWQAEKLWKETQAGLVARGETMEWEEILPPKVPDSENFCATPLLAALFDYTTHPGSSEPLYADPDLSKKINEMQYEDRDADEDPELGSREANKTTDFEIWKKHYQSSKIFPKPERPDTASLPSFVFSALSPCEKDLAELILASKRAQARFPIHYEDEPRYAIRLPQIGPVLKLSNLLSLRATAYLYDGKPDMAWSDLKVLFKLQQGCQSEPMLISHLVGLTSTGITLNPIWEGLALDAWTPAELQKISTELAHFNFLEEYHRSMRFEYLLFVVPTLDDLKVRGGRAFAEMNELTSSSQANLIFQLLPRGIFDMGKVAAVHTLEEHILPLVDVKNRRYNFDAASALEKAQQAYKPYSPTDLMLKLITPSANHAAIKMVEIQADVDMARIACELELFQRTTGYYPKALEELKRPLPHDIISGNPYQYRTTPNGRYELWCVGWNQKDEAGKREYKDPNKRRLKREEGDWVWAYPAEKTSLRE